jgi:hypothetical protein
MGETVMEGMEFPDGYDPEVLFQQLKDQQARTRGTLIRYLMKGEGEHAPQPEDKLLGLSKVTVEFWRDTDNETDPEALYVSETGDYVADVNYFGEDEIHLGHMEFSISVTGSGGAPGTF